jgi:hypothetical protein
MIYLPETVGLMMVKIIMIYLPENVGLMMVKTISYIFA